ncbi:hypothetical protein RBSH_03117 [Rhodopirellula baltica SH28]|uniref:Uncharacterized protein n=1 Tax=Rhodopirellula baltica SH28 TaxID=993517 RepID=K5E6Y7_RHOBT|nr:hypothetical protein [Rhodopirellula baltica]EKK01556.1 hypothetical protein RBSH_03117 [Rhodopirellula baltica SH28]
MKLTRISAQNYSTLHEEFATNDSAGEGKRLAFAAAQKLLDRLGAVDGPSLYIYTSLFRLCFVNGDDFRLPTITRCTPYYRTTDSGQHIPSFQIAFPESSEMERSDEHWTKWTTSDLEEAIQMILKSLRLSAFAPDGD